MTDDQYREDYEELVDAIIGQLNPRDDDSGEVSIMIDAISAITSYVNAQPCTCPVDAGPPDYEGEPCGRCTVLGRARDVRLDR